MSQRSASKAAAKATAVVSDPPRPNVVMRPSGEIPWKPATTATFIPSPNLAMMLSLGISSIRADEWADVVFTGTCHPCQLRAGTSISCSVNAIKPAVTFSPEETTASYSRASYRGDVSLTQPTNSFVLPDIAETMTITSYPLETSRATRFAARLMRSRVATDVPPNFITSTGITFPLIKVVGGLCATSRQYKGN